MTRKRFITKGLVEGVPAIWCDDEVMEQEDVAQLLNEQQATIEEYKDFCLNLCKFLIQKDFVDEYREKYGKEYKIITKRSY